MPRQTLIAPRRGTASFWTSTNPILGDGELGLETNTGKVKFGNGVASWNALPYGIPGGSGLQTLDPPGAWAGWKAALANIENAPVKILNLGDSITEGTGVTARSQTWPNQLAEYIRLAYPSVPQTSPWGWVPIVQASSTLPSSFTLSGSYSTTTAKFGFRGDQTAVLNANATITFSVLATSIDIWHAKGTASGTFTVKKNGVQVGGNYGGTAATTSSGYKQSITLGTAATYTIVITNNSANPVYINGITAWNGNEASGVNVANAGRHGWTSQSWEDVTLNGTWEDDIATYDPHLVTILLGANDFTSLVGRTAYKENVRAMVNKIRDAQKYFSSIVLISCFKRSEVAFPRWEHYEYALRDLATEMGCAYIDLRDVMPDVGTTEAVNGGYYTDTVHPSQAGYTRLAYEVSRILLDPTLGTKPEAPYVEPILHSHGLASDTVSGFMSPAMKATLDGAASLAYVNDGRIAASPGMKFRQIGCVIRFNATSGQFEFISDAGHYPSGVSSVETYSDRIVVNYSFTANRVISSNVTPDEKLAQEGFTMGPSVGVDKLTIYIGQSGATDYVTTNGTTLTSLTGFITSFTRSTTAWTFNHDTMAGPMGGNVQYRNLGGTLYHAHADSITASATGARLYTTAGALINASAATGTFAFWIMRGGTRKVNPLTDLNIQNSNIWISALMEV